MEQNTLFVSTMTMRGAVRNKRMDLTKRGTSETTLDTSDRLKESGTSAAPRCESTLCFGSQRVEFVVSFAPSIT